MSLGRAPCAFFGHGGGPMPLLGMQPEVALTFKEYASSLGFTPTAILLVTAHWIADPVSVSSGDTHPLLFDYSGFQPEAYKYTYPAPGSPALAQRVSSLLSAAAISSKKDLSRGWDHGTFVPLMLMYPDATVPVVALGLHSSLDPELHIRIGRALSPLRDEGVLIIGSGMSFHNFGYFFARDVKTREQGQRHSQVWNDYLVDTLVTGGHSREEQVNRLSAWATAPSATAAHPLGQEDHLLPLHVLLGAADERDTCSVIVHSDEKSALLPFATSNFEWKSVA